MPVPEFFGESKTLEDADVDDSVIDEGMELVQRLWLAGLAHRDPKPAHMLLGGRTAPDRVYERATKIFSPEDVAEAMASAQGLAIPTQVSEKLKEDGRPILERFRELAPARPPVSIQVWSVRRVAITAAALAGTLALAGMFWASLKIGL